MQPLNIPMPSLVIPSSIITLVKLSHLAKMNSPKLSIELGITNFSILQLEKAKPSIFFTDFGMTMLFILLLLKAQESITSTPSGIVTKSVSFAFIKVLPSAEIV